MIKAFCRFAQCMWLQPSFIGHLCFTTELKLRSPCGLDAVTWHICILPMSYSYIACIWSTTELQLHSKHTVLAHWATTWYTCAVPLSYISILQMCSLTKLHLQLHSGFKPITRCCALPDRIHPVIYHQKETSFAPVCMMPLLCCVWRQCLLLDLWLMYHVAVVLFPLKHDPLSNHIYYAFSWWMWFVNSW